MKASLKAALLSAFVLPGVGHLYLKRYLRALAILFPTLTGFGYLIWSVTASELNRFEDAMGKMQGGAVNLQELSAVVGSNMSTAVPYAEAVFYGIVCIWIFAVIDAYRMGKRKEFENKEISPL